MILVGNKSDLKRNISQDDINAYCLKYNLKYVEISVKENTGIDLLINVIGKNI